MGLMPALSLAFLLLAVVLGYVKKINMGIVAFGLCLILGRIGGVSDRVIMAGFGTSLFIRLLGVTFLFGIAQINGTLSLMTRKLVAACGKSIKLIPIVIFITAGVLSGMGPGAIPVFALMATITISIATQLKIHPIRLAPVGLLGALTGLTPMGMQGVLVESLAAEAGIPVNIWNACLTNIIACTIIFIVFYIVAGWPKLSVDADIRTRVEEKFAPKQAITMAGMLAMAVLTLVFGIDVGLSSLVVAFILMLCAVADEKEAIANVPWGTLLMIAGMGMLITLVQELGGIDLLSMLLSKIMNKTVAAAVLSAMAALLSFVSSATGVVMPTLIPTVPGIAEMIVGVNPTELVYSIVFGSGATVISPLSTGGALTLAAYSTICKPTAEERNKMFGYLFIAAFISMGAFALLALLGLNGILA